MSHYKVVAYSRQNATSPGLYLLFMAILLNGLICTLEANIHNAPVPLLRSGNTYCHVNKVDGLNYSEVFFNKTNQELSISNHSTWVTAAHCCRFPKYYVSLDPYGGQPVPVLESSQLLLSPDTCFFATEPIDIKGYPIEFRALKLRSGTVLKSILSRGSLTRVVGKAGILLGNCFRLTNTTLNPGESGSAILRNGKIIGVASVGEGVYSGLNGAIVSGYAEPRNYTCHHDSGRIDQVVGEYMDDGGLIHSENKVIIEDGLTTTFVNHLTRNGKLGCFSDTRIPERRYRHLPQFFDQ
ncbi:hypothetical protein EBR57_02025 [bacterium]|nr:hypothetical protein [bacterium]